ncbi:hypothetical protein BC828DRAFT_130585 [Blastocladiella britannica]|nr:hypothetical protein BC828DRAFT_130585 [Blastocladiella britannica]
MKFNLNEKVNCSAAQSMSPFSFFSGGHYMCEYLENFWCSPNTLAIAADSIVHVCGGTRFAVAADLPLSPAGSLVAQELQYCLYFPLDQKRQAFKSLSHTQRKKKAKSLAKYREYKRRMIYEVVTHTQQPGYQNNRPSSITTTPDVDPALRTSSRTGRPAHTRTAPIVDRLACTTLGATSSGASRSATNRRSINARGTVLMVAAWHRNVVGGRVRAVTARRASVASCTTTVSPTRIARYGTTPNHRVHAMNRSSVMGFCAQYLALGSGTVTRETMYRPAYMPIITVNRSTRASGRRGTATPVCAYSGYWSRTPVSSRSAANPCREYAVQSERSAPIAKYMASSASSLHSHNLRMPATAVSSLLLSAVVVSASSRCSSDCLAASDASSGDARSECMRYLEMPTPPAITVMPDSDDSTSDSEDEDDDEDPHADAGCMVGIENGPSTRSTTGDPSSVAVACSRRVQGPTARIMIDTVRLGAEYAAIENGCEIWAASNGKDSDRNRPGAYISNSSLSRVEVQSSSPSLVPRAGPTGISSATTSELTCTAVTMTVEPPTGPGVAVHRQAIRSMMYSARTGSTGHVNATTCMMEKKTNSGQRRCAMANNVKNRRRIGGSDVMAMSPSAIACQKKWTSIH